MKKTVVVSAFHLIYISVLAKLLSFLVRILLARKREFDSYKIEKHRKAA